MLTASIQARRASKGWFRPLACASGLYFHQPSPGPELGDKRPANSLIAVKQRANLCDWSEVCLQRTQKSSCSEMVHLYTSATLDGRKISSLRDVPINCRCSSVVEQLICNQLVGGSSPFAGSWF